MEFKGTPTPWRIINNNGLLFVESAKETIKQSYGQEILTDDYWDEEWKIHDVKLVAAAPELLSALQEAIAGLEWRKENQPTLFNKADDYKLVEWRNLISKILE